ncbi:MAG: tRNA adenosine(34) deaminase TadA [Armatimonadota bacterium]|nr:tRNA adenosine(34) deaminase TadA [Armatimonadota bacterium]MCX7777363.1 tRNA adenosine(34) deaminase TadA [Armatimonadota bacterium]MDW8025369.1 tRNA adenosine(34) deaminase TadA [Armatimonadota bacterium]
MPSRRSGEAVSSPIFVSNEDVAFMRLAIEEAMKAFESGEVPVGAIVVCGGKVVARAHNMRESLRSPLAHAEMLAIEAAAKATGDWRLNRATLYVTLEPCPMCAGAMIQARLGRLVFGAYDERAGAAGSVVNLFGLSPFDGIVAVVGGVLCEECAGLLRRFFEQRR